MGSTRAGRLAPYALGAGAILVVTALVWSLLSTGGSGPDARQHVLRTAPGVAPHEGKDLRRQPHAEKSAHTGAKRVAGDPRTGTGAPSGAGAPGLRGAGWSISAPAHQLVLQVRSSAPIGEIGYVVPTSADHYSGRVSHAGMSWRMSTTVYGRPDYARVWIQAGERGTPVTCTILVDGHVTDQRSTTGPYGASMCQG